LSQVDPDEVIDHISRTPEQQNFSVEEECIRNQRKQRRETNAHMT
jgi:hypothetical protein